MSEDREADVSVEEQPRELSPAAKRALAEAEERRRKEAAAEMPPVLTMAASAARTNCTLSSKPRPVANGLRYAASPPAQDRNEISLIGA